MHSLLKTLILECSNPFWRNIFIYPKVHTFLEGHKVLRNLHRRFDHIGQIYLGDSKLWVGLQILYYHKFRRNYAATHSSWNCMRTFYPCTPFCTISVANLFTQYNNENEYVTAYLQWNWIWRNSDRVLISMARMQYKSCKSFRNCRTCLDCLIKEKRIMAQKI